MPKIFISYRRDDSQYQADRLHAALKRAVRDPKRDIFIDVDNIPLGVDFAKHIDGQVAQCDVFLAVIGPNWQNARDPETGGRRLDDPKDFVRLEIESALRRGIRVVPVLLDGTTAPNAVELPEPIRDLATRNGMEIRRLTFEADVTRLVRGLSARTTANERVDLQSLVVEQTPARPKVSTRATLPVLGWVLLLVLSMAALYTNASWQMELWDIDQHLRNQEILANMVALEQRGSPEANAFYARTGRALDPLAFEYLSYSGWLMAFLAAGGLGRAARGQRSWINFWGLGLLGLGCRLRIFCSNR